ncbi:Aspartate aminotransferase [Corchorus olitorius]|uniref:Aspartate aminotransferase n=1 Tax=Corchorus olitorius TaxID=93759 RepID=A0A1R3H3V9_9ROSI|nr:Aspartate aminotransferase [Corchorus olitorius]
MDRLALGKYFEQTSSLLSVWRYTDDGLRCIGLTEDFKKIFRLLAKEINARHRNYFFHHGDRALSEETIEFDPMSESIFLPQHMSADNSMIAMAVQGIRNDLTAFIRIFKNFVRQYGPRVPNGGRGLKLPPEVRYFLKIWDNKAKEVTDEEGTDEHSLQKLR